jgi:hypothetical protein
LKDDDKGDWRDLPNARREVRWEERDDSNDSISDWEEDGGEEDSVS